MGEGTDKVSLPTIMLFFYRNYSFPIGGDYNTLTVSSCRGNKALNKLDGVLDMTLNCIKWLNSISRHLDSVEYLFIAITTKF